MSSPLVSPPTSVAPRHRRWPLAGRPLASVAATTMHLLLGLPIAIVSFVLTVVLGALSLGLLVIYPVALPILTAWLAAVRGLAALERGRVRALLGYQVSTPPPPPRPDGWHRRLWATARHHTTWRAVGYHLLRLPVGVVVFACTVAGWALLAGLIALPLSLIGAFALPAADTLTLVVLAVAGPLVALALLPVVAATVTALGALDAAIVASLLGVSDADRRERRIEQLHTTRSDLVDIAEQERRRIERDLHDGAGQQLVSLAMTLGMAREKLDQDPQRARALLDEAHAEAKQALVGLRDIVRGISPAILTDRGLGAALSAVAARSAVPVSLTVEIPQRPDATTEGIAYYVVCESIGNAIRHAGASHIRVAILRRGDTLHLEIEDDGRGGADPSRGTGLRGLAGRIAAIDGGLEVASPPGGPTVVRADLPIRSTDPATDGVATATTDGTLAGGAASTPTGHDAAGTEPADH